ncbi:MAG: LysM peptidoglycan-binding domain-containing protein [Candidatus Binataceae bacterium]
MASMLSMGLLVLLSGALLAQEAAGGGSASLTTQPLITAGSARSPVQPHRSFLYTIRPGDSLGSIANQFGVPVDELTRLNHLDVDADLYSGSTIRIPNPFIAHERDLNTQIDRLTAENQQAEAQSEKSRANAQSLSAKVAGLSTANAEYAHALRTLPWWRGATVTAVAAALVMFGVMLVTIFEWWVLRSRFRAVAEMNDSLRRLDYKYRAALAKAELRLQELYGRRRHGIQDGQERPKIPEETEIERLSFELKEILARHLKRLGPPGRRANRARWREIVDGIGSPVEARSLRR